jgi:hypothetical protein
MHRRPHSRRRTGGSEEVAVSETPDIERAADGPDPAGAEADPTVVASPAGEFADASDTHPGGAAGEREPEAASPEVVRAQAELGALAELDLEDHPDAYQRIHVELQSALTSIDDA